MAELMLYTDSTTGLTQEVSTNNPLPVASLSSLVGAAYDYVSLSYTGDNLTTVVYKTGGSGGTTVATLTLGYDINDNLTSVTKS